MSFPRVISVKDHHYLQEVGSVWDREKGRSKTIVLSHLGPCDERGNLLHPPRARVDRITSTFSVGSLLPFYAAARELRLREQAREMLDLSEEEAGHHLVAVLNQTTAHLPLYLVPDWVRATPLPRWENLETEDLDAKDFDRVLHDLCPFTPQKVWEDHGAHLQDALTRAWRARSREPPGVYYDITKQPYYGYELPYAEVGDDTNGGVSTGVGFGMVVSEEHHHPYLCRALPGAQNDARSVGTTVEMLQARGFQRLRMVMDRGLATKDNLTVVTGAGYELVGLVRGWSAETVALTGRWGEGELERKENVVATSHGRAVYARAMTTSLFGRKMRLAVVVNLHHKAQEREGRDLALQELEGPVSKDRLEVLKRKLRVQDPRRRKKKGYVPGLLVKSRGRRGFEADPKAVERDRGLDGRFLVFSTDLEQDGPGLYRTYFARDGIEKVFRTGKGEPSLGPIRYQSKGKVDAYATLFYEAALLWSWAERSLKRKFPRMSLCEALRTLENLSWVRFGAGKKVREWSTQPTEKQEAILQTLGASRYLPTY